MAEELEIENRLDRIADIHNKLSVLMKDLPKGIPQDIKQKIIEYVLGDKDLQGLINGITYSTLFNAKH